MSCDLCGGCDRDDRGYVYGHDGIIWARVYAVVMGGKFIVGSAISVGTFISALQNGAQNNILFAKNAHAATLQTTIFATLHQFNLACCFCFGHPLASFGGWQRGMKWVLTGLYACSWALLMKASYDAGAEVQSGALGWMSLLQNQTELSRYANDGPICDYSPTNLPVIRADTVDRPVWTPDQLVLSTILTAYCVLAPRLKERRFQARLVQSSNTIAPKHLYAAAY